MSGRRGSKRYLIVSAAVAGAAALGIFWTVQARRTPDLRFETVQVDRGRIAAKVTATGTLSALVTVQVGSQVSGRIQDILVDFNSPVKKGDLIAKIDPRLFQASLEQAKANLASANGNLAKARAQATDAERQYSRAKDLRQRDFVPQADVDTAQANAEAARAQIEVAAGAVEQARAAMQLAEVNLGYTNIVSPTDGVVISRNVDAGQTVAASLQAPTLFLIAEDLLKMQVDTSVAEADIGKLQPGMTATFTVDAYPSERFSGAVRQIRNSPQTLQNVVTYDAVIDVPNPDLKLKPGMTANVTFVYAEKDDALRISNAVLRFRPTRELLALLNPGAGPQRVSPGPGVALPQVPARGESPQAAGGPRGGPAAHGGSASGRPGAPATDSSAPDGRTVWVLRGATPAPVPIRVGISDGTVTEVVEGELRVGDPVVSDALGGPTGGSDPAGGRGSNPFRPAGH